MNFESKAEKLSSEIFIKKSFIVKKRKITKPEIDGNFMQKLPKKSNVKNHGRKKLARNIVSKHKN